MTWTGQEVGETSKERSITDQENEGCVRQDQHAGNHHGVWGGKDGQEGGGGGGGAEHLTLSIQSTNPNPVEYGQLEWDLKQRLKMSK